MHYYKILKHKAGFDEAMTDWEKIFTHYIADTDKHVIFGPLPLTFKSDGGTIQWTVYGKAPTTDTEMGVLPLTFNTAKAGNAVDWSISGNNKIGKNLVSLANFVDINTNNVVMTADKIEGTISVYTTDTPSASTQQSCNRFSVSESGNYILSGVPSTVPNGSLQCYVWDDTNSQRARAWDKTSASEAATKTMHEARVYLDKDCAYHVNVRVQTGYGTQTTVTISPMVRLADTSATFEPYQIGVGQRKTTVIVNTDLEQGYTGTDTSKTYEQNKLNATNRLRTPSLITVNGTVSNVISINNGYEFAIRWYSNGLYVLATGWNTSYTIPANFTYNSFGLTIRKPDNSDITNAKSITITIQEQTYSIPITVNSTPQDIYIGDTPLTAGETVSKTSTGVDIELFSGENTVSTTLFNKPETSITYTDYLGVGEYVDGQWQIPLTISHITDNLFDKNAHDTANGFIDNKKVYWDGLKQCSTINDNNYFLSEYMPVTAGKGYCPTDIYYYDALREYYSIFFYTADKQLIDVAYRSHETVTPAPENAAYMRVCVAKNKADNAMMTTKPTSEYIPHKQSTDYTVPIDAPLTEGQSVSNTVEITAYEGTNTLDTTLTVKPDASITYEF